MRECSPLHIVNAKKKPQMYRGTEFFLSSIDVVKTMEAI